MAGAYLDTRLKGRDYLSISDFSGEEIRLLLNAAHDLKRELKAGIPHPVLKGKTSGDDLYQGLDPHPGLLRGGDVINSEVMPCS